jgi:predicted TIM-barrel fold metal-dependent hydrolase
LIQKTLQAGIDADALFGFWPYRNVDLSTASLVALLHKHGLEQACVCATRGLLYDAADGNQETLATCADYPELIPVATLDPRRLIGYREEIRNCRSAGIRLFRFFPEHQGWSAASPAFRKIAAEIAAQNGIVMIGGDPAAAMQAIDPNQPAILLMVHTYGLADVLALAADYPGCHFSVRQLLGPGSLGILKEAVGIERLVFGSNMGLADLAAAINVVKSALLSSDEESAVFGGNMRRLLEATHAAR